VIKEGHQDTTLHPGESATQADLDFTAECRSAGDAKVYLRYALESGGQTLNEDSFWFTDLKNVDLPNANVAVKVKQLGPGEFAVDLLSPALAYRYWLEVPGVAFRASDNGFELYPQSHREITIRTLEDVPLSRIEQSLIGSSLVDSYR
jgi:beta-mannosidase